MSLGISELRAWRHELGLVDFDSLPVITLNCITDSNTGFVSQERPFGTGNSQNPFATWPDTADQEWILRVPIPADSSTSGWQNVSFLTIGTWLHQMTDAETSLTQEGNSSRPDNGHLQSVWTLRRPFETMLRMEKRLSSQRGVRASIWKMCAFLRDFPARASVWRLVGLPDGTD